MGEKLSEEETEVSANSANIQKSETKFQEFLFEADLDGDGNINYEEFITMIFKEVLQSIICILFYMINDKCFIGNMHIM